MTSSVTIKILKKEYKLKAPEEAIPFLKKAEKVVNDNINSKVKKFGMRDKQDLLAMIAFDAVVQSLHGSDDHIEVEQEINELSEMIREVLEDE